MGIGDPEFQRHHILTDTPKSKIDHVVVSNSKRERLRAFGPLISRDELEAYCDGLGDPDETYSFIGIDKAGNRLPGHQLYRPSRHSTKLRAQSGRAARNDGYQGDPGLESMLAVEQQRLSDLADRLEAKQDALAAEARKTDSGLVDKIVALQTALAGSRSDERTALEAERRKAENDLEKKRNQLESDRVAILTKSFENMLALTNRRAEIDLDNQRAVFEAQIARLTERLEELAKEPKAHNAIDLLGMLSQRDLSAIIRQVIAGNEDSGGIDFKGALAQIVEVLEALGVELPGISKDRDPEIPDRVPID